VQVRDSGSGRVIAVVLVFLLLVAGGVVSLNLYHRFKPRLVGGVPSPTASLQADHVYNFAIRYRLASGPGVRIDSIKIPTVSGLDLTVTGVDCKARVAQQPMTEGPNLGNGAYDPTLGPKAYFAKITRKLYGYKIGTSKNPEVCAVVTAHSTLPGTYHIGHLTLDWRAGLFVGSIHDQTDAVLTFASPTT
jgi:hypothetical protein